MKPDVMVPAGPQKSMQDVTPPDPVENNVAETTSQPMTQQTAQPPAQPQPKGPVPSQPSTPQQPMFPADKPTPVAVQKAATPESTSQTIPSMPEPPNKPENITQPPGAKPQALVHKPKTNWLIIVLAVVVSAGLAVAAYSAFKN